MEELDKTLQNLRGSSEYHRRQTTESATPLPGWPRNSRNFRDPYRDWRRLQNRPGKAGCVFLANVLNKKKMQIQQKSITFYGFVFLGQGISPDPKKKDAFKNAKPPTTTSGMRSFLGMATYCAKFIPSFSNTSEPLRKLTKKDAQFQWNGQHEQSFNRIKELLASAKVMAYFDSKKRNRASHGCLSLRIICHPDAEHARTREQTSSCICQSIPH